MTNPTSQTEAEVSPSETSSEEKSTSSPATGTDSSARGTEPTATAAEPETASAEPAAESAEPDSETGAADDAGDSAEPEAKADGEAAEVEKKVASPDGDDPEAKSDGKPAEQEEAAAASDESDAEAESGGEPEAPRAGIAPELLEPLQTAHEEAAPVEGKVIGWNQGGFHVVLGTVPAFCPRSEMEVSRPRAPKSYIDETFRFLILRIEEEGRRIVLSRAAVQRHERANRRKKARAKISPGAVLTGRVASLTDFGAFVDLGGVQGLVHVSEISRERVNKPSDVLTMGQTVEVKVLKVEQGGRRISLSMKALAPDPWKEISDQLTVGSVVTGKVEKIAPFGVFVELQPGITGLLPASTVDLPAGTSLARRFHVDTAVDVQIMNVDVRRRRISLALEGSSVEGSRTDYQEYKKSAESEEEGGFNVLAAALRKVRQGDE